MSSAARTPLKPATRVQQTRAGAVFYLTPRPGKIRKFNSTVTFRGLAGFFFMKDLWVFFRSYPINKESSILSRVFAE